MLSKLLQSIGKTLSAFEGAIPNDLLLAWVHASLIDGAGKSDLHPMYGVDSFREVYIPHLLRYFDRCNYIYDASVKKLMLNKVKEMIRLKQVAEKQMPIQCGANPLCVWDVSHMIQSTPIGIYKYHEIMSWMCLGLHTGQRAISLGNLKWKDIHVQHFVDDDADNKMCQIDITFVRGKNNFSWNHRQTLEGNISIKTDNPLFWLDQLYKEQVHQANVSLFDEGHVCLIPNDFIFQTPKNGETGFRDSTDVACMKDQINKVAVYCGYPANFFTNHSGRSGMQICYYILRKLQGKSDSDTWEDISLYLGYAPKAQNQFK